MTDLECATLWSDNALPPLCETVLVSNKISDFDDVARNAVVQDLDGLSDCDATREEFD